MIQCSSGTDSELDRSGGGIEVPPWLRPLRRFPLDGALLLFDEDPALVHWFYAKGGRVTRELDHSHHRLAVVFQVWWSSGSSEPGNNEDRAKIVVDRLSGPEGPLAK